ncbi:MAG: hypothetical protein Q7R54_01030 [bacterium]|nr:hypothetical protein [bacterium]
MMTMSRKTKPLITSDHPKGRQATDLFRATYNLAKLDDEGAQILNENGDKFQVYMLEGLHRYSRKQPVFADAAMWVDFYRRIFGKEVDLTNLHVAVKPNYPCWPIVMVPGVSNNDAFDACRKQLGGAWRYTDDLNSVRDIVKRPDGAYVVWVKQNVEADPDLASISAEKILELGLNTVTLRERLVLDSKHFDETKQHLDIENWTLCAGSRDADGNVPYVYWSRCGRGLGVDWDGVDDAYSDLRARAAVC